MRKVFETFGFYPGFISLPYKFENTTPEPLTVEQVASDISFSDVLDEIPEDASIYFNVHCSGSSWWGRGRTNLSETYSCIVSNSKPVFSSDEVTFDTLVATTEQTNTVSGEVQYPEIITIGLSYKHLSGEYTVIIANFTYDRIETETGAKSGLRTVNSKINVVNNTDHDSLIDAKTAPFWDTDNGNKKYDGSQKVLENPVDRYINNSSIPISANLQKHPVPLFGKFADGDFLQYRSGYIGSDRVLLYDTSVSHEHLISRSV